MGDKINDILKDELQEWRQSYYTSEYPLVGEILSFLNQNEYLRKPQIEAVETYLMLRVVKNTPTIRKILQTILDNDKKEFRKFLKLPENEDVLSRIYEQTIFDDIESNVEFVKKYKLEGLHESISLDYASYIFALTMGAGKTWLIATIIYCEFALALEYEGAEFMKNALVFAPGKTIIESLKDIANIELDKLLPKRLAKQVEANTKLIYTQDGSNDIPVIPNSSFNIIVTNTEKISLKKARITRNASEALIKQERNILEANRRLQSIASLPNLGIFSDEAHHTYGQNISKDLKRVRETINWIHEKTPIIAVINMTGTPYVKGRMLHDVVYYYGLTEAIENNILKSVEDGIRAFDVKDQNYQSVLVDTITHFFTHYDTVALANGSKAKIALYFKSEEHLQESKEIIEHILTSLDISPTVILVNTQKSSTNDIREFKMLNNPNSQKRVILLIDKGTEGWDCPSLFATALIRDVSKTSNFILQASTRCLRQVEGNNKNATIYLNQSNQIVLNKALKENFGVTLSQMDTTKQEHISQKLTILKEHTPKLVIKKTVRRVIKKDMDIASLVLTPPLQEDLPKHYATTQNLTKEGLEDSGKSEQLNEELVHVQYTALELVNLLSRQYTIDFKDLHAKVNELNVAFFTHIQYEDICNQIETQLQNYEVVEDEVTTAMSIIKTVDEDGNELFARDEKGYFYHTISITKNGQVHKNLLEKDENTPLGHHYTPYNFDSAPERNFYQKIIKKLKLKQDEIQDIYFTGGLTNPNYTDFYFEWRDADGRYHNYYPDFLIVKKNGKFLIVEIKAEGKEQDLEVEAKARGIERIKSINPELFDYQIIHTGGVISEDKLQDTMKILNNI